MEELQALRSELLMHDSITRVYERDLQDMLALAREGLLPFKENAGGNSQHWEYLEHVQQVLEERKCERDDLIDKLLDVIGQVREAAESAQSAPPAQSHE